MPRSGVGRDQECARTGCGTAVSAGVCLSAGGQRNPLGEAAHCSGRFERTAQIHVALARIAETAGDMLQRLDSEVLTMADLGEGLEPLAGAMAEAYTLLVPRLQPLKDQVEDSQAVVGRLAARAEECARLPEGVVIDLVFRVVRVPALDIGQFAAQVASTCRGVLADLPHVLLGIDGITAILRTIEMMSTRLTRHLVIAEDDARRLDRARTDALEADAQALEPHGVARLWTGPADDPRERTARIASYRWLLGVHLFNLATLYCRDALERTRLAVEQADEAAATQALGEASAFLRGTTAAMWYSGNFSAATYQQQIRPAIVRPGTCEGLSGSEMIDYKQMKAEKDRLGAALVASQGRDPDAWPRAIAAAVEEFRAVYIEDMEHHMRLASARIGGDTSLAQKVWKDDLPGDVTLKTATGVLRDMATLRRREFPF